MKDEMWNTWELLVAVGTIGFVLFAVGLEVGTDTVRKEAVTQGHAYWAPTGPNNSFEWNKYGSCTPHH